jgi:hypothetical protein
LNYTEPKFGYTRERWVHYNIMCVHVYKYIHVHEYVSVWIIVTTVLSACIWICLSSPSNQSFQQPGYGMSIDDCRVAWWWKGGVRGVGCTRPCISCTPIDVMYM